MRIWTVRPSAVWQQIRTLGRVFVDPARVAPDGWVHPQSAWLARQLRMRLTGSQGRLSWWAYCTRPDLRGIRHLCPNGSREVLIEFEPPPGAAVVFPSWAWNVVFMGTYLPLDRTDFRAWRARLKQAGVDPDDDEPKPFRTELVVSWERLFAAELRTGAIGTGSRSGQAAKWWRCWTQLGCRGVREFVGTNRAFARAGSG